jgi:histidinol-phosphate aminotransferase
MQVEKLARQCILDRKEYVPGKPVEEVERELGICDIIKMASNENPLGTSPLALEAMIRELQANANRYPESLCYDLVGKLAEVHGLVPERFFLDNGADGVITMIGLTFIDPGDEVVYGALSFPAYENIATKMDGVCVPVPLTEDYRLDIDGFIAALTPRTKVVFLCNPNNPTGTIVTHEEFERLLEAVPGDVLLVSDEAYYEFADRPDYPQTIPYLESHPNLIILRTFSKVMGLAGLRVGYAVAHPDVIRVMLKAREPFPVNRIAQAGALAALDDSDFIVRTLETNREGREQFYAAFEELGLRYYPTQTNFIFVDLERPVGPVFDGMLRRGVIVRPLTPQGVSHGMRVTIGTREQNERTLEALREVLEDL